MNSAVAHYETRLAFRHNCTNEIFSLSIACVCIWTVLSVSVLTVNDTLFWQPTIQWCVENAGTTKTAASRVEKVGKRATRSAGWLTERTKRSPAVDTLCYAPTDVSLRAR